MIPFGAVRSNSESKSDCKCGVVVVAVVAATVVIVVVFVDGIDLTFTVVVVRVVLLFVCLKKTEIQTQCTSDILPVDLFNEIFYKGEPTWSFPLCPPEFNFGSDPQGVLEHRLYSASQH